MPLRREEERGGSIVLDVYQTDGNDVWTPVSIASYWLKVVSRTPRLPEDSTWLVPHRCFYSIGRGHFPFRLAIPLSARYFGVPMVLLTMSFWAKPKYFPQLK